MVDARGVEIPYLDRDGNELKSVSERFNPAKGQKFFLKGGVIDEAKYEYRGPETMPFEELAKRGYKLPFYADLSKMPEMERKVIWGMMVGEEGRTKIPVLKYYTEKGFDPEKHMLQSYGTGWQSAISWDRRDSCSAAPGDCDYRLELDDQYRRCVCGRRSAVRNGLRWSGIRYRLLCRTKSSGARFGNRSC